MKPNFKDININVIPQTEDPKEWENKNGIKPEWETVEHINVRPAYTSAQLEGMEHLNYAPKSFFLKQLSLSLSVCEIKVDMEFSPKTSRYEWYT